ncbi:hypothetical protein HYFRA_00004754 [Hymenoscyphus fraxineus]|uniref:N-acetyltransferase domain-containing protein n=1 Tax=Hymenoscyphus fraxineus TaxID=746836 RepID=A0A9N9PP69_9HELO|nr:hypothetical protein HYFRA_00004754 [Hymenoscyphus fraxineus]
MPYPKPTLRPATEQDIPSLLPLVLTSFRSFPLFSYLHSPLDNNLDLFHDTIYHWTARFLIGILDERTEVVVAEVPGGSLDSGEGGGGEGGEGAREERERSEEVMRMGWEAMGWLERMGMDMSKGEEEMVVVGFAIWEGRGAEGGKMGDGDGNGEVGEKLQAIIQEVNEHTAHSPRQDQDPLRMEAFKISEANLRKQFYNLPNPTLYLDALCVDFRYQRRGIGKQLLETGLNLAKVKGWDVWTEASPMGLGLYLKMGFRQVGEFVVGEPDVGGGIRMPVLKCEVGSLGGAEGEVRK